MTTLFFGARWDAPMVDTAVQVPTPVGQACYVCGDPIADGDRGLVRGRIRTDGDGKPAGSAMPVHAECDMLGVIGHLYGVCGCSGHGSTRAAGLLLLERLNAERARQGRGPL